jgi:hypothetical protein
MQAIPRSPADTESVLFPTTVRVARERTGQGGTVLAKIHCFPLQLSSTLDNARQRRYKAPQ